MLNIFNIETGGFFRMTVKLLGAFATTNKDMYASVSLLGCAHMPTQFGLGNDACDA